MPFLLLVLLYVALCVPCLSWLVARAERTPWPWDYLLVVGCCLGWFLGWGVLVGWVMTWDLSSR